jgi:tellurite methyltransferase
MLFHKDNYEQFYGRSSNHSYGSHGALIERIPSLISSGSVLDLGAGDGRHSIFLAEKGFSVKATDLSEAALEKLQRIAQEKGVSVTTELANLATWTIDDEYDVMIAVQIFQHLQTADALRLMHEVKHRTRRGGVNLISLFTSTGDRYLMDREQDPGAFYPEDGWLKQFYAEWTVLEHVSHRGELNGPRNEDGSAKTSVVERILARKPNV